MGMVELQHAYIDAQEVSGVAIIDNQFVQETGIVVQGTDQLCGDHTAINYYSELFVFFFINHML